MHSDFQHLPWNKNLKLRQKIEKIANPPPKKKSKPNQPTKQKSNNQWDSIVPKLCSTSPYTFDLSHCWRAKHKVRNFSIWGALQIGCPALYTSTCPVLALKQFQEIAGKVAWSIKVQNTHQGYWPLRKTCKDTIVRTILHCRVHVEEFSWIGRWHICAVSLMFMSHSPWGLWWCHITQPFTETSDD